MSKELELLKKGVEGLKGVLEIESVQLKMDSVMKEIMLLKLASKQTECEQTLTYAKLKTPKLLEKLIKLDQKLDALRESRLSIVDELEKAIEEKEAREKMSKFINFSQN